MSQECFSLQLLSCSTSSTGWFSGLHIKSILIRMMMMFVRIMVSVVFRIEWEVNRYKVSLNIRILVSAAAQITQFHKYWKFPNSSNILCSQDPHDPPVSPPPLDTFKEKTGPHLGRKTLSYQGFLFFS